MQNVEAMQKALSELKKKLQQLDELITREACKSMDKANDYIKIRTEMKYQHDELKEELDRILSTKEEGFSIKILTLSMADTYCDAYFELDKNWYPAHIISVNEPQQTADVMWLGYKERAILSSKFIKVYDPIPDKEFSEGKQCECLYRTEGQWYKCVIEKVLDDSVIVRYKKWHEQIPKALVRKVYDATGKRTEADEDLKIPESLKVKPSDTEHQRKIKKKKVKALKHQFKIKKIEKFEKDKQNTWQQFANTNKSYNKAKESSLFKSPDTVDGKVGVTVAPIVEKAPTKLKADNVRALYRPVNSFDD